MHNDPVPETNPDQLKYLQSENARLAALLRAAMERDARHRAERQLARMEDHLLRDIGLTRDDVRRL